VKLDLFLSQWPQYHNNQYLVIAVCNTENSEMTFYFVIGCANLVWICTVFSSYCILWSL